MVTVATRYEVLSTGKTGKLRHPDTQRGYMCSESFVTNI